eukprot:7636962-Lingulodinium_polyedra.AAC.1
MPPGARLRPVDFHRLLPRRHRLGCSRTTSGGRAWPRRGYPWRAPRRGPRSRARSSAPGAARTPPP